MAEARQERRKYLRAEAPLEVRVITKNGMVKKTQTKDISPLGIRFEMKEADINVNDEIELAIDLPDALSSVHTKAKVVWKKKLSTENGAPCDIGCEFTRIEEDNKTTFLKYFCDFLYEQGNKQ
jgi:c-di-GMP-binding flagellar brake protein YcgR